MRMRKGDIILIQDLSEYIEQGSQRLFGVLFTARVMKKISNKSGEVLRSRSDGKVGNVYFPSLEESFDIPSQFIKSKENMSQKLRRMGIFSF